MDAYKLGQDIGKLIRRYCELNNYDEKSVFEVIRKNSIQFIAGIGSFMCEHFD